MPETIRKWENILTDCQCILDNFLASIVAKYTSGSNFMISWPIIFVANVLPFWSVPEANQRWKNILEDCRCIWDNFLASLSSNYISGNNFMISWPIIFVVDVLPFWSMTEAIRRWENILKDCWCILDNFPAHISAKYTCCNLHLLRQFHHFLTHFFLWWSSTIMCCAEGNPSTRNTFICG